MILTIVGSPRTIAARGVLAVLFGLMALAWPGITLWSLVILFGAWAIVSGVEALASAFAGERDPATAVVGRGWLAFEGIVSIAAGALTFLWPDITALALLMVIAARAIIVGAIELYAAVKLRKENTGEWLLGMAGLMSIAFGSLVVIFPGEGALAITWLIGWYAVVTGAVEIYLAWKLHRLENEVGVRRPVHGTPASA